jgi:hypothetical protein
VGSRTSAARGSLALAGIAALATVAAPAAAGTATPHAGGDPLAALVARARAERLADDPGWLALGHWRPTAIGGFESEVDGPAFFRAPRGKTDPAAELDATLAGFLAPPSPPGADELDDAACRFPARLAFLAARLGLDPAALPPRSCPRRDDFLARLSPQAVTLVFSSYYLDNPSSAFGHTLLRLDKAEQARGGRHFELLDYGINFAATPDTGNAILYAVKGVFGLFKGEFTAYAYYYKVREYSEAESRDLWEYDLALEPAEVDLLARHLWELGGTWFDYWYLDENCSYHLLGALEAAAPRLGLLARVRAGVVLPADTVKAVYRTPGLVARVRYRPSIRSQFRARTAALAGNRTALDALAALDADPASPLPPALSIPEQAAILDAAADLVDLRHFRRLVVGEDPAAAAARQTLLERRSALRVPSTPLEVPVPEDRAPQLGHGSARLGVGAGASRDLGAFGALDLRVALHDLADPQEGYPELASIEFLPTRLRLYAGGGRVELEDLSLVRIASVNPLDRFDRKPSWTFRVGATTVRDAGCDRCLAGIGAIGGGLAATGLLGGVDLLATADVDVEGAPSLSGIEGVGVRVGLGPSALLRVRAGPHLSLLASGGWRWLPGADPDRTWTGSVTLRFHVARDFSIALDARADPSDASASGFLLGYF